MAVIRLEVDMVLEVTLEMAGLEDAKGLPVQRQEQLELAALVEAAVILCVVAVALFRNILAVVAV